MSEQETKSQLVKLGVCPKCGKGQIVKGTGRYACNYFKSVDDKCTFVIWGTYFGKEITDEIVTILISGEETEVYNDLQKQDKTTFSAALQYVDGFIKPIFKEGEREVLNGECPICGDQVAIGGKGYGCVKFWQKDDEENRLCNFYISKIIAEREISIEETEMLLNELETPFLNDFVSGDGKVFPSRLKVNDSGEVVFNSDLCDCPKCGGKMFINPKAYNCGNWKEKGCDFSIWREIGRRDITPEEAIELCKNKVTETLKGFKRDGGEYEAKLMINDDFKVVII